MEIPWWAQILIGVIVGGVSGYIYMFVPKNGQPNMAMALFFFIGMIFIIIGVIKFFFIKSDTNQELKYNKAQSELDKTKHHHVVSHTDHTNRVEAQLNRIYAQNNEQLNQTVNNQHTSDYAKTHPYHMTQQIMNTTTNTLQSHQNIPQHPAHQQLSQSTNHHTSNSDTTNMTHSGQNNPSTHTMSIIICNRCGNGNPAISNYCHQCGNRLK